LPFRATRAAIGWLVEPLRQPGLAHPQAGGALIRVAAIACLIAFLYVVVELAALVAAATVEFLFSLLVVGGLVYFIFTLSGTRFGPRRRRRR
jgi:hypothetical protein